MYKEITTEYLNDSLYRDGNTFFLTGDNGTRILNLDGTTGPEIAHLNTRKNRKIKLHEHLWFVYDISDETYTNEEGTPSHYHTLSIYSIDGQLKQTIDRLEYSVYFHLPADGNWIYLVSNRLYAYNTQTNEYRELGAFPLPGLKIVHNKSYGGLHFFTWNNDLVALRDKNGEGLEEAYRIEFPECDKRVHTNTIFYFNLSWQYHLLYFHESVMWVSFPERSYRINVETGETLSIIEGLSIPERMQRNGNIGYSISESTYCIFDFETGRIHRKKDLGKYSFNGEEYNVKEYTARLLHEGLLYVSMYIDAFGRYFVATFDIQKEEFIWETIVSDGLLAWIDVVGDRMVVDSFHELRIYQRSNVVNFDTNEYIPIKKPWNSNTVSPRDEEQIHSFPVYAPLNDDEKEHWKSLYNNSQYTKIKKVREVTAFNPSTGDYSTIGLGHIQHFIRSGVRYELIDSFESIPISMEQRGKYTYIWRHINESGGRKLEIYSEGTLINSLQETIYAAGDKSHYCGTYYDSPTTGQRLHNLVSPPDEAKILAQDVPYHLYEEEGIILGYADENLYRLNHIGQVIWHCTLTSIEWEHNILGIANGLFWIRHMGLTAINLETGMITHQLPDCYLDSNSSKGGISFLRDTDKAIVTFSSYGVRIIDSATAECIENYFFADVDPGGIGAFEYFCAPLLQGNYFTFVGARKGDLYSCGWAGIFDLKARKLVWVDDVIPWKEHKINGNCLATDKPLYISESHLYIKDIQDTLHIYQRE